MPVIIEKYKDLSIAHATLKILKVLAQLLFTISKADLDI